jgi:hypothetical protein
VARSKVRNLTKVASKADATGGEGAAGSLRSGKSSSSSSSSSIESGRVGSSDTFGSALGGAYPAGGPPGGRGGRAAMEKVLGFSTAVGSEDPNVNEGGRPSAVGISASETLGSVWV